MLRVTGIGAALTTLALLTGCEDKPKETPTTTSTAASTAAKPVASVAAVTPSAAVTEAAAPKNAPMPRGPAGMMFAAVKGLTLDTAQSTKIDEARKQLKDVDPTLQESAKDGMKALDTELAAQVKAGKIEASKLKASYDAIEKANTADQDNDVAAVNALHAALTSEQRKAVAAELRTKQASVDAMVAKKEANDALIDDKAKAAGPKPEMGNPRLAHQVAWLTADITDLDEKQKKDIAALTEKDDKKSDDKKFEDLAKAFESDGFDAKKSDFFTAKNLREPLEARTTLVEKLTKILKPEQREKLAAKIAEGPPAHGGGAMMAPHGDMKGGPGPHGGLPGKPNGAPAH